MKKNHLIVMVIAATVTFIYIRRQRMDIEIARFDYMMKVMKEEQKQDDK